MTSFAALSLATVFAIVGSNDAGAQTPPAGAGPKAAAAAQAPSMVTPSTTVAPTRDATSARVVPTPTAQPRTTQTGGNTNGGAN